MSFYFALIIGETDCPTLDSLVAQNRSGSREYKLQTLALNAHLELAWIYPVSANLALTRMLTQNTQLVEPS